MSATREQIVTALLALLGGAADFQTVGRRNRAPESFAPTQTPALMLLNRSEMYRRPSPNLPAVREMHLAAVVYCDAGSDETAVPAATVNAILDRFDALLAPDDFGTGFCTLGGLVYAAVIEGEITEAPGDITGKSLAVVPILITLP